MLAEGLQKRAEKEKILCCTAPAPFPLLFHLCGVYSMGKGDAGNLFSKDASG